tara:strand:+ start:1404 stop:1757 length:354 start_codon:yes stop_codon:yes gene_type:complete
MSRHTYLALRALHGLVEELAERLEADGVIDLSQPANNQPANFGRPLGGHSQRGARSSRTRGQRSLLRAAAAPKRKRKVSAYQKEFGRQLKKLKKKHPRTPVTRLMKRAHTATRKARR